MGIYMLILTAIALLVIQTGNSASPFIALWASISLFAGVFGIWGFLPIIIITFIFVMSQYITSSFNNELLAAAILSSMLPATLGLLIWRSKSARDELNSDNRAYRNLANELSEVANKSEVVINAIGDGVIATDNRGVIQLINPTAQQITGWAKQDALSLNYRSVLQFIDQKDAALDSMSDPIQQSLNINQQIRDNDLILMTKSGKKIMLSLVVSPVGDVGSGVIIVFHDVTKEKAEEREQAEFISTASHEMRTPVASIEGYLGLALNPQTATIDARAQDFIQKAQGSAQHLGRLFQDLLDVSKADDGRISNNPKVIDIISFTHDVVQGLQQKANEKGLKLTYKPSPEDTRERHIAPVYSVNLDNDHIREIINNLVENAIKYTPNGEVTVDIDGDDDHVVISVKDSGIGIPIEDIPHLFQKFYRVDNANTRNIGGTGLGLYLSRRLAEIIGGRIWASSIYGSGSTFFLELPRISSKEAESLSRQESFIAQQEAKQKAINQPQQTTPEFIMSKPANPVIAQQPTPASNIAQNITPITVQQIPNKQAETVHSVPRGQALTPEQIAAYVTKQRALAAQQAIIQAKNNSKESPIQLK